MTNLVTLFDFCNATHEQTVTLETPCNAGILGLGFPDGVRTPLSFAIPFPFPPIPLLPLPLITRILSYLKSTKYCIIRRT